MGSVRRHPKAIETVKIELKKYEEIESKLEELIKIKNSFVDERAYLDNFLKIMYTDTIIKKNNLYVYNKDIEEDPWDYFVNLLEESAYPEYKMYENYKLLPQPKKDRLLKKANKKAAEYQNNEDGTILTTKIAQLMEIYSKRKDRIDDEFMSYLDGQKMYSFYKDMLLKIKQISDMLK